MKKLRFIPRKGVLTAVAAFLTAALASSIVEAKEYAADANFYRDGNTIGGRYWVLGDAGDWYLNATDKTQSASGAIKVSDTKDLNGNPAKVFEWKKGKDGYVALADYSTQANLTKYKDAAAIAIDLKVFKAPKAGVEFSMKGDTGKNAAMYIQDTLKGMTKKKWYTVFIPLSCMIDRGANFDKSVHLLQLRTSDKAKIGLANVRLERMHESMKDCNQLVAVKLEK